MSILNITYNNFSKGKYELHKGMYEQQKINQYIDKYEKMYMVQLLGATLYKEFVADLVAGVPQTQKFIDIYNEFIEDSGCGVLMSDGMIEMILGFIYFEYLKDQINQVWVSGVVAPSGENSKNASTLNQQIYTRYNGALKTYRAIQQYICDNGNNYTDFNGIKKEMAYWI